MRPACLVFLLVIFVSACGRSTEPGDFGAAFESQYLHEGSGWYLEELKQLAKEGAVVGQTWETKISADITLAPYGDARQVEAYFGDELVLVKQVTASAVSFPGVARVSTDGVVKKIEWSVPEKAWRSELVRETYLAGKFEAVIEVGSEDHNEVIRRLEKELRELPILRQRIVKSLNELKERRVELEQKKTALLKQQKSEDELAISARETREGISTSLKTALEDLNSKEERAISVIVEGGDKDAADDVVSTLKDYYQKKRDEILSEHTRIYRERLRAINRDVEQELAEVEGLIETTENGYIKAAKTIPQIKERARMLSEFLNTQPATPIAEHGKS